MKKKLFCALIIALIMAGCASSAVIFSTRIGYLTRLNTTEDEFKSIITKAGRTSDWSIFTSNHEMFGVKFYDSLMTMQMALEAREIDEIALPEMTALYLMHMNPDLKVCCAAHSHYPMSLSFGFRADSRALAEKINGVLKQMEEDFTLANLQGQFINNSKEFTPIEIAKFPAADTIKVALTGDMPPIDYVAADGKPAGFNTALLAEIGRRLRINIEMLNIETGTRTAALTSGRVDIVFWYETSKNPELNADAPDGVILSEPYYSWNTFLHICKKTARQ